MCLNSGSEAVELALRLSDIDAKLKTQKGGVHAGRTVRSACVDGGFYGRTYRPARKRSD
jgi:4-aminobutyrate aminotransferase-like enzyme